MEIKCRIWWPKQLASLAAKPTSTTFLFGWPLSSSTASSLDIVVAFACTSASLSLLRSNFQEVITETDAVMPLNLQDKSKFCVLGTCVEYVSGNGGETLEVLKNPDQVGEDYGEGRRSCCCEVGGLVEQCCSKSVETGLWIQLVYEFCEGRGKVGHWIPTLHHLHWNGQIVSHCDVHVIIYEIPMYGIHHFSLNSGEAIDPVKAPTKKPKWVDELRRDRPLLDLDTVILAINSSAAAISAFEFFLGSRKSVTISSIICRCLIFICQVLAVSVASISTLFYIILQLFHKLSSFVSKTWIYDMLFAENEKLRPLFWLQSCVEYAEKAALHRHSMWSSLVVDLLLGNLIGLALLYHAKSASAWISTFASDITNELLRSGCVWLMGVPAGFKLNTELAGVLGMVSLNAIQIWSTLWFFISFLLSYFINGLALLGILFGATVPAALIIDMTILATLHVTTLHGTISLLYSWQIQALAALWRLFRGRKWNPLRRRLDSYDYSVKQHIVGSLLFTPLLLLLPTISVFYIFFTILTMGITLICVFIEVTISMIHGTPYVKVFLGLVRKRRFPSGISVAGQVILPHYKQIFSGMSDFLTTSAHNALTGKRTPCTLQTSFPSILPWMRLPSKEYWLLCYNSILACMVEYDVQEGG
ncbi:hypothetical protein Tsubulata_017212 [Turnera subulata]|uniref:Uncharacterized protein n=1 Tax=Turnera subulata TaxID=218843 RepID=A0A9Q0FM45_9ROSI|nr:hypothetical protein Tsubulata_017212 [Turnera subulata]